MNQKKAIPDEIDTAFLYHEMVTIYNTIGLRGIVFGLTAAAVTFDIGHLIGV